MKVVHAQAKRLLDEYKQGELPDHPGIEWKLGTPDAHGRADFEIVNNPHASDVAVATSVGVIAAPAPAPEIKCLQAPKIVGLPNVGQYVDLDAGVWEEPAETPGDPAIVPSGIVVRWLYDKNEEDPVVIPEGDPHGYGTGNARDLLVPMAAIGRTITARVTRGATTVYSENFGPIGGGLTEFTFPAPPVRDTDTVSAESGARSSTGGSAPGAGRKTRARAQTPSSRTKSGKAAKVASVGKKTSIAKGARKPTPAKKAQTIAKKDAAVKKPKPAVDRVAG